MAKKKFPDIMDIFITKKTKIETIIRSLSSNINYIHPSNEQVKIILFIHQEN